MRIFVRYGAFRPEDAWVCALIVPTPIVNFGWVIFGDAPFAVAVITKPLSGSASQAFADGDASPWSANSRSSEPTSDLFETSSTGVSERMKRSLTRRPSYGERKYAGAVALRRIIEEIEKGPRHLHAVNDTTESIHVTTRIRMATHAFEIILHARREDLQCG